MTLPPLPLENGILKISASFLEKVETCSRASEYYKLYNRIAVKNEAAQTFGKHVHTGKEAHYRLREYGLSQDEITQRVGWILQEQFEMLPTEGDELRTVNWAMELYKEFVPRFENEQFKVMQYEEPRKCKHCTGLGKNFDAANDRAKDCIYCNGTGKSSIMAEVPFIVPLYDHHSTALGRIPIYIQGFIDLPMTRNDSIYVRDYKTTLQLGESFWLHQKMSMQPKTYAWAFEELTKRKVSGYNILAIRTQQPSALARAGKANRKGEVKSLSNFFDESICEQTFYLSPGELEEWKMNATVLCEEFLSYYIQGYYPKKTQWCSGKYGRCQYVDVCETFPVTDRMTILMSGLYKEKDRNIQLD